MKYDIVITISYPKKGAMGKTDNWRVFKPVLDKSKCVIVPMEVEK